MHIRPKVSIIVPCRNEEQHIGILLRSILIQSEPLGGFEVIFVDGLSDDDTLSMIKNIVTKDNRFMVLNNRKKFVSSGMNIGIRHAKGEIIVRMDAHCEYPNDYIQRLVSLLETSGADNVGGVLLPIGTTDTQKAICAAYQTPIGTGVALRGHIDDGSVRDVDAVWGGCWRRNRLIEIGLFDEAMVRNQDDELCFRLRKMGGRILQSSSIRISYYVRKSFKRLLRQYMQYGFWKARLIRKHPGQSRLRHFIPALFIMFILISSLGAIFNPFFALALATGLTAYSAVILLVSFMQASRSRYDLLPGIILALLMMHSGYGLGFIFGILNLITRYPPASSFQSLTR